MKIPGACLLLTLACAPFYAQTAVEIPSEPSHHQIFQNADVRVFKVEIAPHTSTLLHRHHHDYFFVALAPATLSSEVPGKPPVTLKLQPGEVHFTEGNFAHTAKNLGDKPFPHVTIELLKDTEVRKHPTKWDEDRALHVHHNGTQEVLFVKDGVRVSDFELQPGGMVHNQQHPGPRLMIAVTDIDIRSTIAGKGTTPIQLKSGEIMWLKGGYTDMLMNAGKNPASWITLEFP
jgi:quercetin dioxygenase-like cupin family protein